MDIGHQINKPNIMLLLKNSKTNFIKNSPGDNGRYLKQCQALLKPEIQISADLIIIK